MLMRIFKIGSVIAVPAMLLLTLSATAMDTPSQVVTNYRPAFEVASIRLLPSGIIPTDSRRGINIKGNQVYCFMQLSSLIATAYRLKPFQITGPDWLELQRLVINARIPDGATKDQVPEMLKSLLADRFGLIIHWEEKSRPVYALVVAKGGPKLKKAAETDARLASTGLDDSGTAKNSSDYNTTDGQQITLSREGRTTVRTGGREGTVISNVKNGVLRMELPRVTMDAFAQETLTEMVKDRPILNRTSLKGFYHVIMELPFSEYLRYTTRNLPRDPWVNSVIGAFGGGAEPNSTADAGMSASDPSSEVVFRAVQKLGLKLSSKKAPVKQLIIDHVDKNPTEN
jgi:uncharacterized protein (TIGR03435 family)